jgi:hypothetical protein
MVILARIFRQAPVEGSTAFLDDAQISGWAKGDIAAMWKDGYIAGS